jgi:hypothetical protein
LWATTGTATRLTPNTLLRYRPAAREFDLLAERVLSIAGIYGPNASGKSNLVEAIAWLSTAVGRWFRTWDEFYRSDDDACSSSERTWRFAFGEDSGLWRVRENC